MKMSLLVVQMTKQSNFGELILVKSTGHLKLVGMSNPFYLFTWRI